MAQITLSADQLARAQALIPRGQYPAGTIFGNRVTHLMGDKQKVAVYVTDTFLRDDVTCFLGDGSSAMYVMLAILERNLNLTVRTVNAAVLTEYILSERSDPNVTVKVSAGTVSKRYAGILLSEPDGPCIAFAEDAARHSEVSVLPTTAIFFEQGICARGEGPRRIKEVIAENAQTLVIVADWEKSSQPIEESIHAVFGGHAQPQWIGIRDKPSTSIVTTRYPNCPPSDRRTWRANATNALDRYVNQWFAYRVGHERTFVEIQ